MDGHWVVCTCDKYGKWQICDCAHNDRGPFVQGRIIDLDKVAFEKIASLGAGVITVKVEEIY